MSLQSSEDDDSLDEAIAEIVAVIEDKNQMLGELDTQGKAMKSSYPLKPDGRLPDHQTYQNYKQPPQRLQNSDFQSPF